jgi:Ribbon-helix-helix protein, copG family
MRTTVRIDDELLSELKELASREDVSLTKLLNRVLRQGLARGKEAVRPKRRPYREKTFDMGVPRFDVTKALALAAELEDEAIIEKLARGQ